LKEKAGSCQELVMTERYAISSLIIRIILHPALHTAQPEVRLIKKILKNILFRVPPKSDGAVSD